MVRAKWVMNCLLSKANEIASAIFQTWIDKSKSYPFASIFLKYYNEITSLGINLHRCSSYCQQCACQQTVYRKDWLYWEKPGVENTRSICQQWLWHKPYQPAVIRKGYRLLYAGKDRTEKRDYGISKERLSVWRVERWLYLPWKKRAPPAQAQ